MNSRKKAQRKLDKFIANAEISSGQRNAEWYNLRKTTIGGSEIAKIYKKSKDIDEISQTSAYKAFIRGKLGLKKPFSGVPATRWGTLLEEETTAFCEKIFNVKKIIELGSIKGPIKYQRYSPDGLAVVKIGNKYYIVLFEFKAPYSVVPNEKIKIDYQAQINTGLMTIPVADFALYVNNAYRKCSLADCNLLPGYDEVFHISDKNDKNSKFKMNTLTPLACGLISFYMTKEQTEEFDTYLKTISHTVDESDSDFDINASLCPDEKPGDASYVFEPGDIALLQNELLIDMGSLCEVQFNRLMYLWAEKKLTAKHHNMILNYKTINNLPYLKKTKIQLEKKKYNTKKTFDKYIARCMRMCQTAKHKYISYLPWKLIKSNIIRSDGDPQWEEKITPGVLRSMETIHEIRKTDDHYGAFMDKFASGHDEMEQWDVVTNSKGEKKNQKSYVKTEGVEITDDLIPEEFYNDDMVEEILSSCDEL